MFGVPGRGCATRFTDVIIVAWDFVSAGACVIVHDAVEFEFVYFVLGMDKVPS